jgi:serine/threonine protein kinase
MELPEALLDGYHLGIVLDTRPTSMIQRARYNTLNPEHHNKPVVIKRVAKTRYPNLKGGANFLIEATLDHPNCVYAYTCVEDLKYYYIVMESMEGTLRNYQIYKGGIFDREEAFCYLQQMTAALKYLHLRRVIHRDIKTENILVHADLLIDSGVNGKKHRVVKLCDFTDSIRVEDVADDTEIAGTDFFLAPELVGEKRTTHIGNDVWALGICYYDWLVGKTPFERSTRGAVRSAACNTPYPMVPQIGTDEKIFLDRMLEKDLGARISSVTLDSMINLRPLEIDRDIHYDYYGRDQIEKHYTANTFDAIWNTCKLDDLEEGDIFIPPRDSKVVEFRSDEWITFQSERIAHDFFNYCANKVLAKSNGDRLTVLGSLTLASH